MLSILVIDDEADVRDGIKRVLFLAKPFESRELLKAVDEVIRTGHT